MPKTLNHRLATKPNPLASSVWRTLLSPPLSGAENMACDVALLERSRATNEAVFRVYSWATPTLSFGRNESTAAYDRAAIARAGWEVVRRPTGGRAILHHREITYSVTAPAEADEPIAPVYSWINELLLAALRSFGVDAYIAEPAGRAHAPDTIPCFAEPSAGEITAGGRKLVGSAQYREDGAMLQHGSILVADDQSPLAALIGGATAPPATLEELLGRAPRPAELLDAIGAALQTHDIEPAALDHGDLRARIHAQLQTFTNPQWTWRR